MENQFLDGISIMEESVKNLKNKIDQITNATQNEQIQILESDAKRNSEQDRFKIIWSIWSNYISVNKKTAKTFDVKIISLEISGFKHWKIV